MVIAFPKKLEGISQQLRNEENKEKVGERVKRKKGKEKRIGKKEEEIRAPGMLKTTKIHRSIYNDKKKKIPLWVFVFLLFLMEHSCSKLISRGKAFFQPFCYVKHGFSQWL